MYADPVYKDVVAAMTRLLEKKMEEIGDEPVHETGLFDEAKSKP
jgi:hypothetical protein